MNDLQIQYFLAAARHLSFSKAAQELYISQPAISRQIISLEKELGCPLFERMNKSISLTANGEMFYNFFDKYRTELYDLKLRARLSLEKKSRILHLGVLNNWNISRMMLPLMQAFDLIHPDVHVEINSYEPYECQETLQEGREDIILTIEPRILNLPGISHKKVADLKRVLLYFRNRTCTGGRAEKSTGGHTDSAATAATGSAPDNTATGCTPDAAASAVLTPYDFKDTPFLTVDHGDYVADLIRSVCKPYGFVPHIQPVHSTDAMIMGVQCRLGVAVADSWSRALDNESFGHIILNSEHPLTMVWRDNDTNTAMADFIRLLEKYIQTHDRTD